MPGGKLPLMTTASAVAADCRAALVNASRFAVADGGTPAADLADAGGTHQGETEPSRPCHGDPFEREPGVEQVVEACTCVTPEQCDQGCGGTEIGGHARHVRAFAARSYRGVRPAMLVPGPMTGVTAVMSRAGFGQMTASRHEWGDA